MRPSSQALRSTPSGQSPSLSYSQATGRISLAAKSCAISRSAFCSSVSVKSTTVVGSSIRARLTGQSMLGEMVPAQPKNAHTTRAIETISTIAVTRASAYWSGNSAGRLGAMVLRRSRRHMGTIFVDGRRDVPDLMQDALGTVIFVVVGVGAVIAVISLFTRGRLYDDIGRGGLSIGDDRDMRP